MTDTLTPRSGQAAYRALKMYLTRAMLGYADIAASLNRSLPYIRIRMAGKCSFTTAEAYAIIDKLGLSDDAILTLFPRDPFEFPNINRGGEAK